MATQTALNDSVKLAGGGQMPWLGLGTWKMDDGTEVVDTVAAALELGYRHIDTAAAYGNEKGVGQAVRDSGIPRGEMFVTTKLDNGDRKRGGSAARDALQASLDRLGMDYVDLYLIHWPGAGMVDAWKTMEALYDEGKAKAIGVSNFMQHHLEEVMTGSKIKPMVNQVEHHPYLQQKDLVQYHKDHAIVFEAWSPLMKGEITDVDTLVSIGKAHGKTPAQVTLRWMLQNGVVTIPKTVHRERLEENAGIFDFELTGDQMQQIAQLDRDGRTGPHPDNFGG